MTKQKVIRTRMMKMMIRRRRRMAQNKAVNQKRIQGNMVRKLEKDMEKRKNQDQRQKTITTSTMAQMEKEGVKNKNIPKKKINF